MLVFKNIFLSVLFLTVASRVKGNSTTVTLFDVVDTVHTVASLIDVSAIGVEPNGGTAYVEIAEVTITSSGSPVTTTTAATFVEAASWLYLSVSQDAYGIKENCTFEANDTTAECIIAEAWAGTTATTATLSAQVVPFHTLTVTGPIPTSSSAATILDNIISNRLPRFFWALWGILFMFF